MEKVFKSSKLVVSMYIFTIVLSIGFVSRLVASVNYRYGDLDEFGVSNQIVTRVKADNIFYSLNNINLNQNRDFRLIIPKIGLDHTVQMNVDASKTEEYLKVLEKHIAHAKNTPTPEETNRFKSGNVYLFAHRINFFKDLDKLKIGDVAYIKYRSKTYTYRLVLSQLVNEDQTDIFSGYSPTSTLTLQTCTNRNDTRLILKFDLISVSF